MIWVPGLKYWVAGYSRQAHSFAVRQHNSSHIEAVVVVCRSWQVAVVEARYVIRQKSYCRKMPGHL